MNYLALNSNYLKNISSPSNDAILIEISIHKNFEIE
jgi:hypothetical protein